MRSKAFFLTMDALMAAMIIGLGAVLVVQSSTGTQSVASYSYEKAHYLAEDAMTILSLTKLKDLNDSVVDYLLSSTNLTQEDLDKSVLECMTILWAYNESDFASYLASVVLDPIMHSSNYNYSLYIQDSSGQRHLIYGHRAPSTAKFVVASSRVLSGYKENALPRGYMARAVARKSMTHQTIIIPIEPAGSSHGQGNRMKFTKKFKLDFDERNITNAELYLSVHSGVSDYNSNTFMLDGISIRERGNITYEDEENCENTNAWYVVFNITDILRNHYDRNWHTLYVELLEQSNYNGHFHPGSYIKIEYNTVSSAFTFNKTITKKVYFDNIYSEGSKSKTAGVWTVMPIQIPKNAQVHNVTLHLRAKNVADTYDLGRWLLYGLNPDTDVWVYFNDQLIYYEDHPSSDYELFLDITDYVKNSTADTNTLYISIDSYPSYDLFWAPNDIELYSDPENDPEGSSYIFMNYTLNQLDKYRYGYITVERSEVFGGEVENPKESVFNFRNHELYISKLHVAQLFSAYPNVSVKADGADYIKVFRAPLARVVPSSIIIDPSYYDISANNTIRLEDVVDACSDRAFLPTTQLSYTLFVPSQVPYGDVFDTEEEAVQDAINRLQKLLEGYADVLQADTYVKSPISAANVPSMYGPVIAKLEVWE